MSGEADLVIDLYRRKAGAWVAARDQRLTEKPWLDRFLSRLPKSARVLDLGCGSGAPIGRYLADQACRVTGVDSAPEMIDLFRQNLPDQEAVVSDMRTLALQRRFDGVIAWDSFFHLAHDAQSAMFAVFMAHAEQNAALMFTSGPQHGEALGYLDGEALYHASLDGEVYRRRLKETGFKVIAQVTADPACGGRTIWLAQRS